MKIIGRVVEELYDFYIRRDEEVPAYKLFRGTVSDFEKVEQLYEKLWASVIDSQLGLLGIGMPIESVKELTDDPILLQWEGAEIIAEDTTTYEQYWYLGDGKLKSIGTEVIGR